MVCVSLFMAILFKQHVHHNVEITEICEMHIPNPNYDNSGFKGIYVVSEREHFEYFIHKEARNETTGFDSLYIQQVMNDLRFDTYDYVISYQKRIRNLFWSHYERHYDTGSLIPLSAIFEKEITRSIHIYAIYPKYKYRNAAG